MMTPEECQTLLQSLDQTHILEKLKTATPEDKQTFILQLSKLNEAYPGGLTQYVMNARRQLLAMRDSKPPFEGIVPKIPQTTRITFDDLNGLEELEEIGMSGVNKLCFVLVAGGLGERLGYSGIKVNIPLELVTERSFLQYYIEYILEFQKRAGPDVKIPLAIMTSDDTHDLTKESLEKNNNFGMDSDQITLMKQQKVCALIDNDAHFALEKDSFKIEAKPHGHGDVHVLLHMTGLAEKWKNAGKQYVLFFQDTNPLAMRAAPSLLGALIKKNLLFSFTSVSRKPGEAVGAVCQLVEQNGSSKTGVVEYHLQNALFAALSGGEPQDSNGFSPYPGNTNTLIIDLQEYTSILKATNGIVEEYINPKYANAERTIFKSATRLETGMQDISLCISDPNRVGCSLIDRTLAFSALKNDLATAKQKYASGLPLENAPSCESDYFSLNRKLLSLCGVNFTNDNHISTVVSLDPAPFDFHPLVVLHPSFGVTLKELKSRIKGKVEITKNSALVLAGDITLENFKLDGIKQFDVKDSGAITNLSIETPTKLIYKTLTPNAQPVPDYIAIRGYSKVEE